MKRLALVILLVLAVAALGGHRGSSRYDNEKIGRTATYVIAASDSPQHMKRQADYVCDGTADNVQINAAVALLGAGATAGGEIKFLPGNFYVAASINVRGKIKYKGSGVGATNIYMADGADCDIFKTPALGSVTGFAYIGDMVIHGNKANNTSGNGINFDDADLWDVTIERIFVRNCSENGISLTQLWGFRLRHVVSEYNEGDGINASSTGDGFGVISECKLIANEGMGLDTYTDGAVGNLSVVNNYIAISDDADYAWRHDGGYLRASGNNISNTSSGGWKGGVDLHTAPGAIFTNNKLYAAANTKPAVYLHGNATASVIANNLVSKGTIEIAVGNVGSIVVNNQLLDGSIVDAGTGTIHNMLFMLSSTTVAFNADADTTLYTGPTGRRFALTHAIVIAGADAGATTTLSIGQAGAETDFIPANTLSNLDAQYDSVTLRPIPNTTPLKSKSYAAATVIEARVATQSGGATNTVMLFGTLY